MKQVIALSLLSISMLPLGNHTAYAKKSISPNPYSVNTVADKESHTLSFSPTQAENKMLAVIFRSQEYCRAEVKDFEFETQFNVVGATVYFTGTNFSKPEKGYITSNSLKPLKSFMDRCQPGTIVIFDNVKVIGPDKLLRSIAGVSYLLH